MLTLLLALGSYTFTSGETSIPLDSPPPGATQLVVRLSTWTADMAYGWENIDAAPCAQDVTATTAILIYANGTELLSDRKTVTQPVSFTAYDGTIDWTGTSGAYFTGIYTKPATPWATYAGLPSSLTITRRTQLTPLVGHSWAGIHANYLSGTAEWTWQ